MPERVMIVAGGTGGHIYPALAVAEVLAADGVGLRWLGARGGMEERIVARQGIPLSTIKVSGLRGRGWLGWLLAPFMLSLATAQAIAAIRRFKPGVVLGMGGFVSGPGGLAAWLCRRPLVIHEQNAVPGLTNRILGRFASRVLETYPRSFARGAIATGNPVRKAVATLASRTRIAAADRPLRLLVLGGSRGARRLNQLLPVALGMRTGAALEVWHQTGEQGLMETRAAYVTAGLGARVDAFIEDTPAAYEWADLIVCRAGATTLAEITAAGLPSVLVPFPHAVDDHQTANARVLAEAGAAVLLPERSLDAANLARVLDELVADGGRREEMAIRASTLAQPDAAKRVAAICLEVSRA